MCLIVHAPANVPVPMELIEDTYHSNSDGFGLMWYAEGRVQTFKAADIKPQEILEVVSRVQHCERILHFRMATHGAIDDTNTHPFKVVDGMFMMHNGILPFPAGRRTRMSDTAIFNATVVRPLVEAGGFDALDNAGVMELLDKVLGNSNRLAFMDDTGKVRIFGRELGVEWRDLWCSNTYAWTLHSPQPAHWGMLNYGSSKSPRTRYSWDDDADDMDLYDKWLQRDKAIDARLTKVDEVTDIRTGERYVEVEEPLWETNYGKKITASTAEVLMCIDVELYEMCERYPEEIVAFINDIRENYIGDPVDEIGYAG